MIEKEYKFDFEIEFNKIFNTFHRLMKYNYDIEVDVLITDNKTIREISKEYRGIDKETDVLSFPFGIDFQGSNFMDKIHLGEIVLSFEKIEMQAKEFNHSIKREFAYLFAHGLVHLSGKDHKENKKVEKEFNDIVYNIMEIVDIQRK